jgi:hypothetical protein
LQIAGDFAGCCALLIDCGSDLAGNLVDLDNGAADCRDGTDGLSVAVWIS